MTRAWAELVDPAFTLEYHSDPRLQAAVDAVQQELRCCGLLIFSEWRDSAWAPSSPASLVPDSCCKTQSPGCGGRDHPSNIPYTGCAHRRVVTNSNEMMIHSSRLIEELEKDLSLNTTISFVVSKYNQNLVSPCCK